MTRGSERQEELKAAEADPDPLPDAILASALSAEEQRTYLYLWKESRQGRQLVSTTTAHIASDLGRAQRTSQRSLRKLVKVGLVKIKDRGSRGTVVLEVHDSEVLARPRVVHDDGQLRLFDEDDDSRALQEPRAEAKHSDDAVVSFAPTTNPALPAQGTATETVPKVSPPGPRGVQAILSRLQGVRKSGGGWTARCPAHDDRRSSLSIAVGDDGRILVYCHAGCATEDVVSSLGLSMADLAPPENSRARRSNRSGGKQSVVATYDYLDENGKLLFQVVRFAPKDFRQRRPDAKGGWSWSVKGVPKVPYQLPRLRKSDPALPVFIVEGEKDADRLAALGLVATCNAGGAGKWLPEYAEYFRGRRVVVLPDNDEGGRKHAEAVAQSLHSIASSVKVLQLPDLGHKEDVSDWLDAEGTADKLRDLVKQAPEWAPGRSNNIPSSIIPYRPFPVEVLPNPVARFVRAAADAIGCDPSYIGVPLLSVLAAAIGNTRRIRLKQDWSEPSIVWTAIVGESGTLKTPAMKALLQPLETKERRLFEEYEAALERYHLDLRNYQAAYGEWRKTASKNGEAPPEEPIRPTCRRCLCSDITVEALAIRLAENPRGLLVVRDELAGWLGSFDQYKTKGHSADVAHWLSMHVGGSLRVDRKSGDKTTVYVPQASVSITGGIQPQTLRRVLGQEYFENGLAARFLLTMPPRRARRWTEAEIPVELRKKLEDVFTRLWTLEPVQDGDRHHIPVYIPLTARAKEACKAFVNQHGAEQLEMAEGNLTAAWAKLEGYAARLALLIHLVKWAATGQSVSEPASDAIDEESILAAVSLVRWFGQEAQRVYAVLSESDEERERRRLVELIERKGGRMTVRELMRGPRQYRENSQAAEEAFNRLVKDGLGRWRCDMPGEKGGQPVKVLELFQDGDGDTTPTNPGANEVVSPSPAVSEGRTVSAGD